MNLNRKSGNVTLDMCSNDSDDLKVNPQDFVAFLPWACAQLCIDAEIRVKRNVQAEPLQTGKKQKVGKSKSLHKPLPSDSDQILTAKSSPSVDMEDSGAVQICATFKGDHLVHIKFEKSKHIPRQVLLVLGFAIKFYPHLYGISINGGMDEYTIYEMYKFIPLSNISELDFDNSFCKEANYHILLDNCKNLQVLSLARCRIGDEAAIHIANKLGYLQPASQTLSVLNLSSNQLTDKSVKHFAKALRANRKLSYLNLASNSITDEGAITLLKALYIFPLTMEETWQTRRQHLNYLKEQQVMIDKIVNELRSTNQAYGQDKKKKQTKPQSITPEVKVNKLAEFMALKPIDPAEELQENIYRKRAEKIAVDHLGGFVDVFRSELFVKDGWLYCNGNNTLAYLSIAYNTVSYITAKYLLKVLNHQRDQPRKPKGLVNVCLEGNPLPKCQELMNIDFLLEVGLRVRQMPAGAKRRSSIRSTEGRPPPPRSQQ